MISYFPIIFQKFINFFISLTIVIFIPDAGNLNPYGAQQLSIASGATTTQGGKFNSGDLDSALSSLADNLSVSGRGANNHGCGFFFDIFDFCYDSVLYNISLLINFTCCDIGEGNYLFLFYDISC